MVAAANSSPEPKAPREVRSGVAPEPVRARRETQRSSMFVFSLRPQTKDMPQMGRHGYLAITIIGISPWTGQFVVIRDHKIITAGDNGP